jgi:protein gp37
MADRSPIQWTGATWNPIVGCEVTSPGCKHCYAMRMAARLDLISLAHEAKHGEPGPLAHYRGLTAPSKAGPVWNGKVAMAPDAILMKPLGWKKPRRIFVDAMNDLFFEGVTDEMIDRVFAIMALCPQHTFQILTKRPDRMRQYMASIDNGGGERLEGFRSALIEGMAQSIWHGRTGDDTVDEWLAVHLPLPNVWLGTSVEDQTRADERIPELLETPAAVRFLSCEPMLGPLDLASIDLPGGWQEVFPLGQEYLGRPHVDDDGAPMTRIDWVICGGESGLGARPMHPDWARSLRDQCAAAGVPFFFKQWGEWAPLPAALPAWPDSLGIVAWPNGKVGTAQACDGVGPGIAMFRGDKAITGRLLDGVTHDGMPA